MSYEPSLPDRQADYITDKDLALIFKALGHPARIRILRHLLEENRCICGRSVSILPLAQSTVSQHLKILQEAGLIRGEIEGPKTCYCVNREKLTSMRNALAELCLLKGNRLK